MTDLGSSLHGLCHLLVRAERLDPKRDGLQLRLHAVELGDVAPCTDEVLGHHLARVLSAQSTVTRIARRGTNHLTLARRELDVPYELLLLLLELGPLAIQLPLRLLERTLMLPKSLRRRLGPTKQRLLQRLRRVRHAGGTYDEVHGRMLKANLASWVRKRQRCPSHRDGR